MPTRASGSRARQAAHVIVERFGYLQLDSVAVAGARTHSIVLGSRLLGIDAALGETLLRPGAPLFEYWGHEASWLPMSLYPAFEFRRKAFRVHPWWGDVLGEHRELADQLLRRIDSEGALRSLDLEGESRTGWGPGKLAQRVVEALWSAGELSVRQRNNFQKVFDLTERVIPAEVRASPVSFEASIEQLLLRALDGHGWATTGTLAATWRLKNMAESIRAGLERLVDKGAIVACDLESPARVYSGWIRTEMLAEIDGLNRLRTDPAKAVLLSPFDPVLWDRARVQLFFDFEQRIEIYKPKAERQFGYYCLPVLDGDQLVGRVDLKAFRDLGELRVLSRHVELDQNLARAEAATNAALDRYASFVGLRLSNA